MIEPTLFTWILLAFGIIIHLPLTYAQILMARAPDAQATKDLVIGKDKDWRDTSNKEFSSGFAWADLLLYIPLLILGSIGVILGDTWGYVVYAIVGVLAIYFSIVFWVAERKYTLQSSGSLMYYTFFWGFFLYWGIAAMIYSFSRIDDVIT
ncbi:MAG: hypothetical protein ACW99Q_08470 [Candidatus Kariarchaeaceae archaeon]